jgi:hypothetical protein
VLPAVADKKTVVSSPLEKYFNRSLLKYNYTIFILLNNQRDAALSSCIYSSLQGYSTYFGYSLHPSLGVQLKLQMQS